MCKLGKFLYWLTPAKNFQAYLIKKHISRCLECQKEIEEADNRIKEISIIPNWAKAEKNLWPQIKQTILSQEETALRTKRKHGFSLIRKWHWAVACLLLVAVIGLSLLIHQNFLRKTSLEEMYFTKENPRVKIKYAEIKGKAARPYIYQTPTTCFVWFGENNKWRELK